MLDEYRLVEVLEPGALVLIRSFCIGEQLWSRCRLRKTVKCAYTGRMMKCGDEAFRPITNAGNRMHRIDANAIPTMRRWGK